MFAQDKEIYIAIITSTSLILLLMILVIFAVVKYQSKLKEQLFKMESLKNEYQQEVLRAQLEMREQTLHFVSQEIHDNIGQILSLVKLNINKLLIQNKGSLEQELTSLRELTGKAINDLRQISKSLTNTNLTNKRLSDLVKTDIDSLTATGFFSTTLETGGEEKELEPQKLLIVYRIYQEILNNIIKHSEAKEINVYLSFDSSGFSLHVADNGKGFDSSQIKSNGTFAKGTGLLNMMNRAKMIDATLLVDSKPGYGTSITLKANYN